MLGFILTNCTGLLVEGDEEIDVNRLSSATLEERLVELDAELHQLATLSLRGGAGAVGYRSTPWFETDPDKWIQIDLDHPQPVDQVILVPVIWRDAKRGFVADGFPIEFQVIIGKAGDKNGEVVASFNANDALLPRIAPLVISFPESIASWVKIEAATLSRSVYDEAMVLQFSEILVFNGPDNIALHADVTPSEYHQNDTWHPDNLVDGFVPYLMDAASGSKSLGFVSVSEHSDPLALTFDLEEIHSLDRVHLHQIDLSDTVPQGAVSDFGLPEQLVIQAANRADFSNAVQLAEYRKKSIRDIGPVLKWRFPPVASRYVKLTVVEPFQKNSGWRVSGFAEIEVFSEGQNVSLGKTATSSIDLGRSSQRLAALTDGDNFQGEILAERKWLNQLARRHDLEVERPLIIAELNRRYGLHKVYLTRMGWLAALLGCGIVITFLIGRMIRLRKLTEVRERFAADLHDDLGANLHTIGLLSDLAVRAKENPEKLTELLRKVRSETERSATAVRRCVNIHEAGEYQGLIEDMQRTVRRTLGALEHEFTVHGESYINQLPSQVAYDLFLFYKECLVNISRHSEASRFETHITADHKSIRLIVNDNGIGLTNKSLIPKSLERRARLLKAKYTVERNNPQGTIVQLDLPVTFQVSNQ